MDNLNERSNEQWVDINDRLPEEGVDVLAVNIYEDVYQARYITDEEPDNNGFYCTTDRYDWRWIECVTHWMPIPKLPKRWNI